MNTRKVIYLLELLRNSTKGHETVLNQLYKNAIDEDSDVATLVNYLNSYTFFRGVGNSFHKKGTELSDKLHDKPSLALQTLQDICQINEMIGHEVELCRNLMRSPEPFSNTITVLKKQEIVSYLHALTQIACTCVYLIAVYSGLEALKNITWIDTDGIQEVIFSVNKKFIPALCKVERPFSTWVIQKKRLGGRALFGGEGFFLTYEENNFADILCSGLHKEPIGTHAFLNVRAFESDEIDVPYCWGIGNIVSISPASAFSLLEGGIATKPRSPSLLELSTKLPSPFECLRKLTDGAPFCISPDDMVSVMNQWQTGREIMLRKQNNICLFCGKPIQGDRVVCTDHFTSELR